VSGKVTVVPTAEDAAVLVVGITVVLAMDVVLVVAAVVEAAEVAWVVVEAVVAGAVVVVAATVAAVGVGATAELVATAAFVNGDWVEVEIAGAVWVVVLVAAVAPDPQAVSARKQSNTQARWSTLDIIRRASLGRDTRHNKKGCQGAGNSKQRPARITSRWPRQRWMLRG
jgi:hypothetical protein